MAMDDNVTLVPVLVEEVCLLSRPVEQPTAAPTTTTKDVNAKSNNPPTEKRATILEDSWENSLHTYRRAGTRLYRHSPRIGESLVRFSCEVDTSSTDEPTQVDHEDGFSMLSVRQDEIEVAPQLY